MYFRGFLWANLYLTDSIFSPVTLLFCSIMSKNRFWFLRSQTHRFAAMGQTLELLNTSLSIRSEYLLIDETQNPMRHQIAFHQYNPKNAWLRTSLETTEWCQIPLHCVESAVFGVTLVHIFAHSEWIQRDTPYLSLFSLHSGKYEP